MEVTDKKLVLENKLIEKLDLIIKRLQGTDDAVMIIDGDEGIGKTNFGVALCYYVSFYTKREYDIHNIFFDLDKLIKFASETKEQIIHWDEAALGGLSIQWWKQNQIKFVQLLMIARKKKHFIVMCIPKFNRLNEFFVVDRSIALIHVYARQNIYKGRFFYFTKQKKEKLFDEWKRKRVRLYIKHRSFGGRFPKAMEKVFDTYQINQYERKKDKAILDLVKDDKGDVKQEKEDLEKYKYAMSKHTTDEIKAKLRDVSSRTIRNWKKLNEKYPNWRGGAVEVGNEA